MFKGLGGYVYYAGTGWQGTTTTTTATSCLVLIREARPFCRNVEDVWVSGLHELTMHASAVCSEISVWGFLQKLGKDLFFSTPKFHERSGARTQGFS